MSDSESDIEIKSALPKITKKPPPSPTEIKNNKKITTKMMIIDALIVLKTRKGVSLYAIKKFLTEKYNVNTERVNFLIKKSIKNGVEDGTFVQMKGIGASGSFKLATVKEKPKKKKSEKTEKDKAKKTEKAVKKKENSTTDKKENKVKEKKVKEKVEKEKVEKEKPKKTVEKEKKPKKKVEMVKAEKKTKKNNEEVKKKVKIAKGMQTPAKKRAAMMKRKSIGSIIKPPKMKPKLHA